MTTTIPPKAKQKAIRDAWEALAAPMSLTTFTHHCIQAGLWSQDEWFSFAFNYAKSQVARALRALDARGLPFAGPTATAQNHTLTEKEQQQIDSADTEEEKERLRQEFSEVGPLWKQRLLWDLGDYKFNIDDRLGQVYGDYGVIKGLTVECLERFQFQIVIPEFH